MMNKEQILMMAQDEGKEKDLPNMEAQKSGAWIAYVIGVMLLIFVNRMSYTAPYIIVLHLSEGGAENAAMEFVRANTKKSVIKSKSVTAGRTEINMEVRLKDGDTGFVNQLCAMNGVDNAVLVSYNGDYMS